VGTAGKRSRGSPLYYWHPDPEGLRRLFREWYERKWDLRIRYRMGHPMDVRGRPILRRGPVVEGRTRWEPFLNIVQPKRRMDDAANWGWYVCHPNRDETYVASLVNSVGLEPRWTNDGNAVKLFRVRIT
jgi:hypothetical protein